MYRPALWLILIGSRHSSRRQSARGRAEHEQGQVEPFGRQLPWSKLPLPGEQTYETGGRQT